MERMRQGDAVTETVNEGAHAAVGEVRTFLIADVRGYTRFTVEHGDEAAAKLAAQFAAIAREVAASHDGQVIELRGDEALAVFSSARQALRAAVHLQDRLAKETMADTTLPLKVGIGLDAGEALSVEGGYRGAALNLAARLCALAGPREVLASESVVHLARKLEGLAYAERGAVQLKGFADPVRVVQVMPEEAAQAGPGAEAAETARERPLPIGGFLGALPAGPLVARDDELRRILPAVDAVAGGSGRLLFLVGEPGVGKTRLAQEITLQLRNRSFLVASGRCYEPQEAVPFYPFLEALGTLYTAAPSSIRAGIARRWPYLVRLLPNVHQPAPAGSAEGREDQERLFWSVTGFVQVIAEEMPVALLLDDLHWADTTSLALLQHLARHTRAYRALLLGTYRDVDVGQQHPLERALQDLNREQLAERVSIRGLEREGTAALIATTFDEEEVSVEFSQLVYQHTEGNPFFVQEVLRALVERGDIYREDGRWERREVEEIAVPESVRSAIRERLSRLSPEGQEILHEASVLGQTFTFDELRSVGNTSEDQVEAALQEAVEAGLVRFAQRDDYVFSHALTQHTLYTDLMPRRRRRVHLAAGETLERLPEVKRQERAAELAWHFLEGGERERALPYVMLAGYQAEAVFAHSEAERHYRTVSELAREVGDGGREAEALERLSAVLKAAGRFDASLEPLEQAAAMYRAAGDGQSEVRAVAQIGRLHRERGTLEEGISRLQPLLESLESDNPPPWLAAPYVALAHLCFARGRYSEALTAAERAADLARGVGDERILAEAEGRRGAALAKLGRLGEAFQVSEQVIDLAESAGDFETLARTLTNLGYESVFRGELARAEVYLKRALEVADRVGNPAISIYARAVLCQAFFYRGDWKQARGYAEQAAELAAASGPSWYSAYPVGWLGVLDLLEGDRELASRRLQESIAIADRNGDLQAQRHMQAWLAEDDMLTGHPEAAAARLEPLLDRPGFEEVDVSRLLPVLARARAETGDLVEADQIVANAVRRVSAQYRGPPLAEALIVQGMVRTYQGRWEEADHPLSEALALAGSVPYPHAEGRALFERGRLHLGKGEQEQARERLEQALAIFQRLGAQPYIGRTEQALAALR